MKFLLSLFITMFLFACAGFAQEEPPDLEHEGCLPHVLMAVVGHDYWSITACMGWIGVRCAGEPITEMYIDWYDYKGDLIAQTTTVWNTPGFWNQKTIDSGVSEPAIFAFATGYVECSICGKDDSVTIPVNNLSIMNFYIPFPWMFIFFADDPMTDAPPPQDDPIDVIGAFYGKSTEELMGMPIDNPFMPDCVRKPSKIIVIRHEGASRTFKK